MDVFLQIYDNFFPCQTCLKKKYSDYTAINHELERRLPGSRRQVYTGWSQPEATGANRGKNIGLQVRINLCLGMNCVALALSTHLSGSQFFICKVK